MADQKIGPYLVGDSAYPVSPWLIKTVPEGTRNRDEIKFNGQLSSARIKVECDFDILKNRWRILMKRFDSSVALAIRRTVACAVLHNLCLRNSDNWDEGDVMVAIRALLIQMAMFCEMETTVETS